MIDLVTPTVEENVRRYFVLSEVHAYLTVAMGVVTSAEQAVELINEAAERLENEMEKWKQS